MTRTLSTALKQALMSEATGFLVLPLLTISHPDLATPFRIVHNREDIMSRGNLFTACPFEITLPESKGEGIPRGRLVIANPDQWLTPTIRTLSSGITVLLEMVSATNEAADPPEFNTLERDLVPMTLTGVSYDSNAVRGTLSYSIIAGKPFPEGRFTSTDFAGLF